ncbi:hypothetical protein SODALDRAFT_326366 [Sodiomyces alkalinus F11]|uniref:DUF567-domain-containing protein n=1 Tax=Sodiomyces alkalinus (strain CBS 110278 / VKM F-3762 / F11) TaxID=1314773 RepID=A0A3N2Q609_SODAK|nr:hypothetical protein SODALDRAFT_326366 [Sodiomyces alkalinus F11]ROT42192.1 hypothetical protein SODALDRAFT_326366 [Sodiomyces alkalinus F11]
MQSSHQHDLGYAFSQAIATVKMNPMPEPIGVFDRYIAKQTETIILKEKVLSLSGDSFDIKLASGNPLIRVDGNVLSLRGRKKVFDMSGRYLFDIYKEHLHLLHTTYVVEDVEKKVKIMQVRNAFKFFGSKANATFTSTGTGKPQSLVMGGNWFDTSADIVDESSGAVVARIDRKLLNAREWLGGQQTYALVVAPGVDMALMCALCICLDEKNNDS